MLDKIKRILVECANLNYNDIDINSRLREDLNLDSLNCAEILLELEYHFNIFISVDEMRRVLTVSDILNLINSKV